jgi:RNA-directed DNA polymerase
MEGRGCRSTEPLEGKMSGTESPRSISTKQERIAELAKKYRGSPFTTLAHHIDVDWLQEAYRRTRKDAAAGVDGQTAQEYAINLEENLQTLLNRAKSGDHYRAPPVRRVHIPKADGSKTRPIGIPTFEDKILQRAVVMVLEPLYEQEFYECSYGFRPRRGAHDAVKALWNELMKMGGGWVLEADIEDFFGSVNRAQLQDILRQRVRDGVLLRLIGKWLNAGVMEEGRLYRPESGTPQGGVISPMLANIYLHEVLDVWFHRDVTPRLRGKAFLVRYADDFVIAFEHEEDARRVQQVLVKRFAKYGLCLHPEKTRLLRFPRPKGNGSGDDKSDNPDSFDLLGFTLFWAQSRKGTWVVKLKTAKTRLKRAVQRFNAWCKHGRHLPIGEQQRQLALKLRGHDAYYGVTFNYAALERLRRMVVRIWLKWLRRRSHAGRRRNWDWMNKVVLKFHPLPRPRIVHSLFS